MKFLYLNIFRKPTKKIQVSLKPEHNNGYLHADLGIVMIYRLLFLEWVIFQTKVVEKNKTQILCSINSSPQK